MYVHIPAVASGWELSNVFRKQGLTDMGRKERKKEKPRTEWFKERKRENEWIMEKKKEKAKWEKEKERKKER